MNLLLLVGLFILNSFMESVREVGDMFIPVIKISGCKHSKSHIAEQMLNNGNCCDISGFSLQNPWPET